MELSNEKRSVSTIFQSYTSEFIQQQNIAYAVEKNDYEMVETLVLNFSCLFKKRKYFTLLFTILDIFTFWILC